ncbi:TLR adapter interacting with SLC15A4 on the lysosome [Engraulis encrasicolus]|uniref:TLR adapter interacting with SLC15A4 on the lysosome n=1 Tax=Engraulis encrasicolus TaxID=184585 RepID=UPI002FD56D0A
MLCESRLWSVAFCRNWDPPSDAHKTTLITTETTSGIDTVPKPSSIPHPDTQTLSSPCQPQPQPQTSCLLDTYILPSSCQPQPQPQTSPVPDMHLLPSLRRHQHQQQQLSPPSAPQQQQHPLASPLQPLPLHLQSSRQRQPDAQACRLPSPEMEVPCRVASHQSPPGITEALPSCRSVCQHYSDLRIGGDQVVMLRGDCRGQHYQRLGEGHQNGCAVDQGVVAGAGNLEANRVDDPVAVQGQELQGPQGPTLQTEREEEMLSLLPREEDGGKRRPLSDAQLNRYLEQKLLELYRQHLSLAQGHAHTHKNTNTSSNTSSTTAKLLELYRQHLTLTQGHSASSSSSSSSSSREVRGVLGARLGRLRVSSSLQSSVISTPLLQISTETTQPPTICHGVDQLGVFQEPAQK